MPRILSPAAAQAVLALDTDKVLVSALTITHPELETIRIVNDSVASNRAGGTYIPWAFEPIFPDDNETANPSASLTVDNVDLEIANKIRSLSGDPPKCTLEAFLADQPDQVELGPFDFSILEGNIDLTTLELRLGYEEDFLNQAFPAQSYIPSTSPGLFT